MSRGRLWFLRIGVILISFSLLSPLFSKETPLFQKAMEAQKQGFFEKAAKLYDSAVLKNPDIPKIREARAWFWLKEMKNYKNALKDYHILIDKMKQTQNVHLFENRGLSYALSGKTSKALLDFERALKLSPKRASVLYNRGIALLKLDKKIEGERSLKEACRLSQKYCRT